VHLGSINSNNWLPLLAFRKRLIAGEVAPEPSTASVAPTEQASETTTTRGMRHTACRDLQRAQQLHAQGRTYIEIGLELGFGRDTVSKHLAAAQK